MSIAVVGSVVPSVGAAYLLGPPGLDAQPTTGGVPAAQVATTQPATFGAGAISSGIGQAADRATFENLSGPAAVAATSLGTSSANAALGAAQASALAAARLNATATVASISAPTQTPFHGV